MPYHNHSSTDCSVLWIWSHQTTRDHVNLRYSTSYSWFQVNETSIKQIVIVSSSNVRISASVYARSSGRVGQHPVWTQDPDPVPSVHFPSRVCRGCESIPNQPICIHFHSTDTIPVFQCSVIVILIPRTAVTAVIAGQLDELSTNRRDADNSSGCRSRTSRLTEPETELKRFREI